MIKLWKYINNNEYPILSSREVNTSITINHKKTATIMGLTNEFRKNNQIKTPLLSKIPILKYLFQKQSKETIKSEILIAIKPIII